MSPSELAALTGYVLPGATLAAPAVPGAAPAVPAAAAVAPGAIPAVAVSAATPRPSTQAVPAVVGKGTVRAGLLGVQLEPYDPSAAAQAGVKLHSVAPQGPAASAGLQAGDVVQRIGEIERPSHADVLRTIAAAPGQLLPIVVLRDGQSLARSVKLGETSATAPCHVIGMQGYQYDGQCQDGFAHGRGELSYTLQEGEQGVTVRYSGEFSRGQPHGTGTLLEPRSTYEGAMVAGVRHGPGKLTYVDGRPGFEGLFAHGKPAGLKDFPEALFVCTRPDAAGSFRCGSPEHKALQGGPAASGQPATPEAMLASVAASCPSKRRLVSRTHVVWGCGFAATGGPKALDHGAGVEVRGRGTYQCLEREAACRRTAL